MSKVYCSVYNGIGNQLFSYALGLFLAKKYNKELIIDLTKLNQINFLSRIGFKRDLRRKYELHKIGFTHPAKGFSFIEFSRKIKPVRSNKFIIADFRKSHCDLGEVSSNQNIYSVGWGDFNLVKEVLPEMKAKLTPHFEINSKIAEAIRLIQEKNSVAVHVRRTDYLNPKINNFSFGICTHVYYLNAINQIKKTVDNPFFIFFSDEIEYVKNTMSTENCYFVEGNTGFEDFYLMSLCKHFILANSTFSFWAAALNNSNQKTVCVPEYWYNTPLRQADFIPSGWEKIPVK
ncbi:MAG: glycosyl transferase family [Prolixibacteraceae bacterium]|nr:MAG: glycosyl transferase family [Prolixibacteraceae bacterium]